MNESKATRYQRWRRRTRVASATTVALVLCALTFTPGDGWLTALSEGVSRGLSGWFADAVATACFVLTLVLMCELVMLPVLWYFEKRTTGSSTLSPEEVAAGEFQAAMVVFPAALVVALLTRLSMAVAGAWWWGVAGVLMATTVAAAMRFAPLLFAQLGVVRSIERPELAHRLRSLAQRVRLPVTRIDEWHVADGARPVALVTGVGHEKRVLLATEIVREWSDSEVEVVVAHEMAHHRHADLWRTLALDTVVLVVALWVADAGARALSTVAGVSGPADLAALPLLALIGGATWMAATPIRWAESRRQERRADEFALALTGGAEAFGTAIKRLEARHLVEDRPSTLTRLLFHRHPSVAERLALADAYRRTRRPS